MTLTSHPPALPLVREVLDRITAYLAVKGVDSPRLSAEVLLAHALGVERQDILLAKDRPLAPSEEDRAVALAKRRGTGEPVAYIVGEKEFYGLAFEVTPDTLIPRPETEHLIEHALNCFPEDAEVRFTDLGCGSGALAVAFGVERKRALGMALDISEAALAITRKNILRHGLDQRVTAVAGDFSMLPCPDASLDLVLANPPYVPRAEYQGLSREILDFEPQLAFLPPQYENNGLAAYTAIIPEAARVLKPGGVLLMEMGCSQGQAVLSLARSRRGEWEETSISKDLAGLDRMLVAVRSCGK